MAKVQEIIFNPYILGLFYLVGAIAHIIMYRATEIWTVDMINMHGLVFTILFVYMSISFYMTYMNDK